MTEGLVWLAGVVALPLIVVAASDSRLDVERLRSLAVGCAVALLAVTVLVFAVPSLRAFEIPFASAHCELLGSSLFRIDAFSSMLVVLAAALWLLTVAATPRTRLDRAGLRRSALATLTTIGTFATVSPALLVLAWAASLWIFLAGVSAPANRHARRVAAAYLGVSTVLFAAGVFLVTRPDGRGGVAEQVGIWLLIAAALIRKGIFPFHAWVPEVFDRGRLGPALLFSAPQTGAYVTVVLIVPRASPKALRVVAILALVTACYGAALALYQRDARRSCGYLFVSQSALVMTGLECLSKGALLGSLVLWISSGLAFAGIARCVLVLEVRRGRLDLSRHHGGYERMPLLATSFLVLGLACTGFPGTLGFIGQELLVDGAVESFPIVGFFVVAAGALTGLAVLRMYFSLFCGRRGEAVQLQLLPREAFSFGAVAVVLLATGIAPAPIVASRLDAAELILWQRGEWQRVSLVVASRVVRASEPCDASSSSRAAQRSWPAAAPTQPSRARRAGGAAPRKARAATRSVTPSSTATMARSPRLRCPSAKRSSSGRVSGSRSTCARRAAKTSSTGSRSSPTRPRTAKTTWSTSSTRWTTARGCDSPTRATRIS